MEYAIPILSSFLLRMKSRDTVGEETTTVAMLLNNFFPGFNDIYFVLSHRRGIRENGNYVERTVGFGMYYSRNNYTIEEIGDYYYVTTNYDLYVHDKILGPESEI